MSVGVLRNSNRGFDISELILETAEELRLHLKQRGDTLSTRYKIIFKGVLALELVMCPMNLYECKRATLNYYLSDLHITPS